MLHRVLSVCALLLASLSFGIAAPTPQSASPSKRVITHEDLWLMKRVGAPTVSPDGKWAVFAVTEPSYDEKSQVLDLWIVSTDTQNPAAPRRLTGTSGGESGVDWSPDSSRLVFSARREGDDTGQLYLLDLRAGGEAQRLTKLVNGARAPHFSPDGRQIAFSSSDYPNANSEADNQRIAGERKARKWNARIYDGFPVRNWDRWIDDRKPRLWVLDLATLSAGAFATRELLRGTALSREPGFAGRGGDGGDSLDAAWTPDGRGVVFTASTDRHTAAYRFTSTQLWYVATTGGEAIRLSGDSHSWSQPTFTPDGKTLIAALERYNDKVYNSNDLVALSWSGPDAGSLTLAAARELTRGIDRAVTSFASTADSRQLYFLAEEAGHEKIFVVDIAKGSPRRAFNMSVGVYTNLSIAQSAREPIVLANFESATQPPEVVRLDMKRARHVPLTSFNSAKAGELDLEPVRHFWFTSAQGRRIHNMLVVPPGFDPTKKYPLFVVIHGGPHTMWRDQWVLRWNYHLLAAPGYVVLLTNYSGSTGFGEAFAQTIQGDPLKSAGAELNEAADVAIRDFAFIDASWQCAGGASYGGHLANWLQATSTRYRCLVSHAGLINLEAQWGTSDTVYGREVNNGGPVWEQGPVWREQNPIRYAAAFKTPTLVTVGEQDFRVPLNNSLEYWTALQRRQIPSRLVVFPDENHWVLKGENSRLFYQEVHAWLARWLAPPAGISPGGIR
ncbi:MAG: S9 family peptidase [Gammaproteobacteria bacterium]|nr:S9 family peptidase [Gammaproteobacteria bacterium]